MSEDYKVRIEIDEEFRTCGGERKTKKVVKEINNSEYEYGMIVICDVCRKGKDYHMRHFSGTLNGRDNRHLHVCDSCFRKCNLENHEIDIDKLREIVE